MLSKQLNHIQWWTGARVGSHYLWKVEALSKMNFSCNQHSLSRKYRMSKSRTLSCPSPPAQGNPPLGSFSTLESFPCGITLSPDTHSLYIWPTYSTLGKPVRLSTRESKGQRESSMSWAAAFHGGLLILTFTWSPEYHQKWLTPKFRAPPGMSHNNENSNKIRVER